jgi:hypothetical protein
MMNNGRLLQLIFMVTIIDLMLCGLFVVMMNNGGLLQLIVMVPIIDLMLRGLFVVMMNNGSLLQIIVMVMIIVLPSLLLAVMVNNSGPGFTATFGHGFGFCVCGIGEYVESLKWIQVLWDRLLNVRWYCTLHTVLLYVLLVVR